MAKWGEGDPRWIVEERPDATNVNNWHWTEKNAGPWSQERLRELLVDLVVDTDLASVKITEVEKCEGEASANNRKGKLIFFYEWGIVLKWTGRLKSDSDVSYDGKVTIPNLSEENDLSEIDIVATVGENDETGEALKQFMNTIGREEIRQRLDQYIESLKLEFSKGMILPKKDQQKSDNIINLTSGFNKKVNMTPIESKNDRKTRVTLQTITLKFTEKFQCRAEEFYDAMTRVEMVTAFTRGAVKLYSVKGGHFELFGGNISGTFEELVVGKRIVQHWRYKQWPEGHHSLVTMDIEEKNDHTEVNVVQTGVPTTEAEATRNNWNRYYWDAIKKTFGFGSFFT